MTSCTICSNSVKCSHLFFILILLLVSRLPTDLTWSDSVDLDYCWHTEAPLNRPPHCGHTHTHTPVDRLQVQEKHLHPHCSSFLLWHSSDGRPRCHISLWDSTTITQCPAHPLLPLCEGGEPAVEWRKGEAFASRSSQSTANQTHTDIFSVSIVTFHKNIYYVLLSCLLPWTDMRVLCYQIQMMSSKLIYFPDITINIMCEYQHFKDIKSWAPGSCCFLSDNVMVI